MRDFGSEHPAIILPDAWVDSLGNYGRELTFLRCGREALLYAALNIKEKGTILFPAYCCSSMSAPFEKAGWKIEWYRLNEDLTVDDDYLLERLKATNASALLTMNYYGSADTRPAISKAKAAKADLIVIEDFSHCTFCLEKIFNADVDFYVSSLRKSVGIPDGGVVLSKVSTDHSLIAAEDSEWSDRRYAAQCVKARYTWNKNQQDKAGYLKELGDCERLIDGFSTVRPISDRSLKMLSLINGAHVAYARRENMKHMWTLLDGKVRMVPGLERGFDGSPFSLPILVDDQTGVQHELALRGVYTQWLWPICEEARRVCPVSNEMHEKMLSVPIDQRFSWDDIEDMAKIIIETVK